MLTHNLRHVACALSVALFGGMLPITAGEAGGFRLYVSNEKSGDVTVIDGVSNQPLGTVKVGKRPRGIQVTPDGKTVYVALSGSPITGPPPGAGGKPAKPDDDDDDNKPKADKGADGIGILDAASLAFRSKFPVGSDPEQFALSRDGKLLYIANEDVATASVIDIAAAVAGQKALHIVPVGKEPEGVSVNPAGSQVYVTCETTGDIYAIALDTFQVAAHIATGGRPRSMVFTPDGKKAYAASETNGTVYVIDTTTQTVSKTLKLDGGESVRPMGSLMSRDGKKAYISTGRGGTVVVIDTASDAVVSAIKVGPRPWGLALSPDGKLLYAANGPSNDISVVDLASEKEIARVKVGDSPWGIAVGPAVAP